MSTSQKASKTGKSLSLKIKKNSLDQRVKEAEDFLQSLSGGPLNLGRALRAMRLSDEISQAAFARTLGIPRQHLNDIEKGRRSVSLEKAASFASALKQPEAVFIQLALQSMVDEAGFHLQVKIAS